MNIKEAKTEILNTVKAYLHKSSNGEYEMPAIRQRPILLIGPPGVGKTQIMEQVARECQIALVAYTITHHTRQSAVGLPFIQEEEFENNRYSVTAYTMSEIIASIYRKMKSSNLKEGILFIDEINCVSETLAPTMLQFLQQKTFGNQPVPPGWIIVAAGNPPEYNKSVHDFDMVTLDRVRLINIEADLNVWQEYARAVHINSAILSYLELRQKNFYRIEPDVDGLKFVTARGWEDLSNLIQIYEKLNIPITEPVIYEYLRHEEVSEDFSAYYDLYCKYREDYHIEEILSGTVPSQIYARIEHAAFDERLSIVNLLFDGLQNRFLTISREKYLTDQWYYFLQAFQKSLSDQKDPALTFRRLLESWEQEFDLERQRNLLSNMQTSQKGKLSQHLHHLNPETGKLPQEIFSLVREDFDLQRESLEALETSADLALSNAFDFMEKAFGNGQEMVVFVTLLATGTEATDFLLEHPSQQYLEYNQKLLIGTRREQILSEIQRDGLI